MLSRRWAWVWAWITRQRAIERLQRRNACAPRACAAEECARPRDAVGVACMQATTGAKSFEQSPLVMS
jgi:hypothetical protein